MDVKANEKYNQGLSYFQDDRYQEAIESFKQAIQLEPDSAEAHCNLGNCYIQLGRYQEAIDACKQAIRIEPDY
ncbi:MAG: tetratricopeptide repeat protein, partial [Thermodesulfobacteriota bacterium]